MGRSLGLWRPTPDELDPVLLMWWLRNRAEVDRLPDQRVVTQVDFYGAATVSFWLTLTRSDVMLCLTDPGYEINLLVTADLAMFYKLWGGRISYQDALTTGVVRVEGIPKLTRAFPQWFGWADVMPAKSSPPALARISDTS